MTFKATIPVLDFRGSAVNVHILGMPDACPRCHKHVIPQHRSACVSLVGRVVQVAYHCTSEACQEVFLANYEFNGNTDSVQRSYYEYKRSVPVKPLPATFPPDIEVVSPSFVEIFNQALAAEAQGLDQVVGIGLRKSVEFLIKDFAVREHPNDADTIRKTQLGPCIDKYVTDPMVKQVAKRAVWLGNDETHYVRKWETKDVSDLKTLVRLTVNWIDSNLTTERYLAEMTAAGPAVAPAAGTE